MTAESMLTCEDCSKDIRPTQLGVDAHQTKEGVRCEACLSNDERYLRGNLACNCPNSPCRYISLPKDLKTAEQYMNDRCRQVARKMFEAFETREVPAADELWDLTRIAQGELEEAYDWWSQLDEPDYAHYQALHAKISDLLHDAEGVAIAVPQSQAGRTMHDEVLSTLGACVALHEHWVAYTGVEDAEDAEFVLDMAKSVLHCCAHYWEIQGLSPEAAMKAAKLDVDGKLARFNDA